MLRNIDEMVKNRPVVDTRKVVDTNTGNPPTTAELEGPSDLSLDVTAPAASFPDSTRPTVEGDVLPEKRKMEPAAPALRGKRVKYSSQSPSLDHENPSRDATPATSGTDNKRSPMDTGRPSQEREQHMQSGRCSDCIKGGVKYVDSS